MKYYNTIPDSAIPFIIMYYVLSGSTDLNRFCCDYPNECIEDFGDIEFGIVAVYVMGQKVTICNKEELLKFCNG